MSRNGKVCPSRSWRGLVHHAVAWLCRGIAWLGMKWHGLPCCGVLLDASNGMPCLGRSWRGVTHHAVAWLRRAMASCGMALL